MNHLIPFIAPLMCVLWGLICLRIYSMISRRNVWQRRLVAIAAGLGGALVYLVTNMMVTYLITPAPEPEPQPFPIQHKAP